MKGEAMSITEFLLARITEDEAVAREAEWVPDPDDPEDFDFDNTWSTEHGEFAGRGGPIFRHILRNAPARVLAECAAKRAIIDEHREGRFFTTHQGCVVCRTGDGPMLPVNYPCPTVRALATIYANHPDYRPEWAL
jgi:hypothetical protein